MIRFRISRRHPLNRDTYSNTPNAADSSSSRSAHRASWGPLLLLSPQPVQQTTRRTS